MKRSFRAFAAALLIATPLLTSCADSIDPTSPAPAMQPQAGLIGDVLGGAVKIISGLLRILGGPDANGAEVTAWIGSNGGTLKTAAYTLTVPKGAVKESTLFKLTPTNQGLYIVDLSATRNGLLGLGSVDVGSKGFAKPVSFTVSYAKANGVTDPRKLVIVYLRLDGKAEIQPSSINATTKTVTSSLSHFSKYAMMQN